VNGLSRERLVRLYPNGTIDPTFVANADASVAKIALLPTGKILIKGVFYTINGIPCQFVARLHQDGSLDESFSSDWGVVTSAQFAIQADGKILLDGFEGLSTAFISTD
jgi:hypothetical protein